MSSETPELAEPLIAAAEGPAWGGLRRLALNIDYAIGAFSEAAGAALVLAETCILFAGGYYGACAIGRISSDDALWRIWPYIGALIVALAVVAAIPWLSIGFL